MCPRRSNCHRRATRHSRETGAPIESRRDNPIGYLALEIGSGVIIDRLRATQLIEYE